MQYTGLNELREKYLSFFETKGHLRLPSFPLVPIDDNSLLLINAGMAPLKKYFTGELTPPRKRVTTCQKCVRTPDIERVGKTARHGTFFEMLGNFSFGDYFKEQAIPWAWEFLTKVLEIPEERLYVSVYENDDEAAEIWQRIGVPKERIFYFGKEDNFWEIGTGPCGPCSEIYFDRGEKYGCGKPGCTVGCECDRYIEIWNIVFTQFDGDGKGNYARLAHPNIDTGMGLERLAVVMQDVNNLFEVDTIRNVCSAVCKKAGIEYGGTTSSSDVSLRVITDHIRGSVFMISDGVIPSNEGRGYVLRRLIRRAARHLRLLGIEDLFLCELCDTVINESKSAYPELSEKREYIRKTLRIEEERFAQTLDSGLNILNTMIAAAKADGEKKLGGDKLFKLYDTFGFPLDITRDIAAENSLDVDEDGFNEFMRAQKERARNARTALGDVSWNEGFASVIDNSKKTQFVGYTEDGCASQITQIIVGSESQGTVSGGSAIVILDKTPFYAESGGQVGDKGTIETKSGVFEVDDTKKTHDGVYLHIGRVISGSLMIASECSAKIDTQRRNSIRRNHTAAHMLQAALRQVLGSHVEQAGSYVDEKRVRFDFTHFEALTSAEIRSVEDIVNTVILSGTEVVSREMPIEEAKKLGAMALFGEKYGSIVRVVSIPGFSTEFCGGTHLDNTAKAGLFRIVSESSVAAGVRRIEGVTGTNLLEKLYEDEAELESVASILKTNRRELGAKASLTVNELRDTKKALDAANGSMADIRLESAVSSAKTVGAFSFISASFENVASDVLRNAADRIKDKNPSAVMLFSTSAGGKLQLVAACGKDAVAHGAHAGNLLREVAAITGGGGGGRPDSAMAGGKDVSKLGEAFAAAPEILLKSAK
ncbi:MAG TPA: alanine--tRNA ligase [Bacillota bacterium]|nr:alanine--tRNA ligase [Bacillota bacterium]